MKERIGFIGTGTMGRPMAGNLLKAGYPLIVYDINPEPVEELRSRGASVGKSIPQVASQANLIITMLPNSPDVEEVILGKGGVHEGVEAGSTLLDMSTIDPSVSRKVAQALAGKKVKVLDAPVSGGPGGAEAATLTIMVGGDKEIFEKYLPVLQVMGQKIYYCGPNGNGQIVKIINNLLSGIHKVAAAEGLSLGVKAGVDFKILFDVIMSSSGQSRTVQNFVAPKAFKGDFEPGFSTELMTKDLGLALNLSKEEGIPLFLGALSHQIFTKLLSLGYGKKDNSILFKFAEELYKVQLRL
jgi:3-hydroxyisobutyrate dehydrogenase